MNDKKIVQKIILGGIVIKNDKALIIQRSADEEAYPNLWEIPSGKRESFEKSEDAVAREVKEETGLDVEVVMPINVFEFKVEKPDEIRDATQINFLVKQIGESEVKISSEHQNFAWISKDEVNSHFSISDEVKKAILKAFEIVDKNK